MSPERRDLFPDILRVMHPNPKAKVRPVAFLQMYMDESGHSSRQRFVAVGGFVAPADNWIGFHDEWNAALRSAKVLKADGRVDKFHMTDLVARYGIYKPWSEEQRRDLIGRLIEIILNHKLYAVGYVVGVDWFNSRDWSGVTPQHVTLRDPYHHAVQGVCIMVAKATNLPEAPDLLAPEGIACVFADVAEFEKTARGYMTDLGTRLTTSNMAVTVTFGSQETFPQLQAADLLAFELRWRFTKPEIDRWPMRQILNSARCIFGAFRRST